MDRFYLDEYKDKTLVNLSSSILKFFKADYNHPSISKIDTLLLNSNKKKVCVVLLDGLNKYIKECHLSENDFLIKKEKMIIASNFPPTTACCTKAFLYNKYPIESGYLGWSQYFKEYNVTLDILTNTISKTNKDFEIKNFTENYYPNEDIVDKLAKVTFAKGIYPNGVNGGSARNESQFFDQINATLKRCDEGFIYGYYLNPDSLIHKEGVMSKKVHSEIKILNKKAQQLCSLNKDTVFIFIADHGLVDCKYIKLDENHHLWNMLTMKPYLDSRSLFMNVKNEYLTSFKEEFYKDYSSNDFLVLTKEEYLKAEIFGKGKIKDKLLENLGDFLVISLQDKTLIFKDEHGAYPPKVANHSGITSREYEISLSVANLNPELGR